VVPHVVGREREGDPVPGAAPPSASQLPQQHGDALRGGGGSAVFAQRYRGIRHIFVSSVIHYHVLKTTEYV